MENNKTDYEIAKEAYNIDEIGVWFEFYPKNFNHFRNHLWDLIRKNGKKKFFTSRNRKKEGKVLVWLNSILP